MLENTAGILLKWKLVKNNMLNDKYVNREYAGSGHPDAVIAHSHKSKCN